MTPESVAGLPAPSRALLAVFSAAFLVWFFSYHLGPILGHVLSQVLLRLVASFTKQMSRSQLKIHTYEIPTFTVAFQKLASSVGKFHRLQILSGFIWCGVFLEHDGF